MFLRVGLSEVLFYDVFLTPPFRKARILRGSWSIIRSFTRCLRGDLLFHHVFFRVILQKARVFSMGELTALAKNRISMSEPHMARAMFGE